MAFGNDFKKSQLQKKRPGVDPKGDLSRMARPRFGNPADTTIEGSLKQVLDQHEEEEAAKSSEVLDDPAADVDAPLVRLVNSLLAEAVKRNASDIHIEPFETFLRIRYRVDGVLQEIQKVPHKLASAIVSRLKIMAELDICEKRIPQDGSFKFRQSGVEADFRISSLPATFGEKIVMRVMGTANVNNDLSKLGIPERQLKIIRDAIGRPDGLVLVTGPTGSGKTTTLYAALNELNDISVSVFTAEDPVEGTIPGVTQCSVNATVGYTFATILRSLLRQDPDVVLVGEIRDQETAEICIKAALTGHIVLSTLHTNCSVSTISRLINMGIAPYLITTSISCIVAQRLVRRICPECRQTRPASPEVLQKLGAAGSILEGATLSYGRGCPACHQSGYKGRAPVYEVLALSDDLRRLILQGAGREELKVRARIDGMITLREAGLELVKQGITTLEEVLGATNEDETPVPGKSGESKAPGTAPAQTTTILTVAELETAGAPPLPTPLRDPEAPQYPATPGTEAPRSPTASGATAPIPPLPPATPGDSTAQRWKNLRSTRVEESAKPADSTGSGTYPHRN